MKTVKTERQSNFELLRILAMFMIIIGHIFAHCFVYQLQNEDLILEFNNGYFNYPFFFKKLLIPQSFTPMGKTGVLIFLLISGYFMVEKGKQVNLFKPAIKLLGQMAFVSFLLVVCSYLYYKSKNDLRIPILTFRLFNSAWWFVGYYYLIIVFGGLFFNSHLNKLSKGQYLSFLAVLLAIISFSWSGGTFLEGLIPGLRVLIAGMLCYSEGGFIKKYAPLERVRIWVIILAIIMCWVIIWFAYYIDTYQAIENYKAGDQSVTFIQTTLGAGGFSEFEYRIIPIALSVLIFELFRRLNIQHSRLINQISDATFMVYLIHENDFVRNLWRHGKDMVSLLYKNPPKFCLFCVYRAAAVFAVGFGVNLLYKGILYCFQKGTKAFVK